MSFASPKGNIKFLHITFLIKMEIQLKLDTDEVLIIMLIA